MERLAYEMRDFGVSDAERLVAWQRDYRLDDTRILDGLGTRLGARWADLLDIAAAAYVTDRLCRRRPKRAAKDGRFWSRELRMRVAVRDHGFWSGEEVANALRELLSWLTDDSWTVEFTSGPSVRRHAESQDPLFPGELKEPVDVGLLSGGLDSLLGAERDLRSARGQLLLVTAGTQNRLIGKQRELARGLATLGPRKLQIVVVPVGLTQAGKRLAHGPTEESQRTRGFVFLALGVAVAATAGVDRLRVYENGPGALNLGLTPGQRGSMNTRAARPETLAMMSSLASRIAERDLEIANPDFWRTKAEMCRDARADAHRLIAASVSCDTGLTRRISGAPLCGECTSCLLRRQALLAAGLGEVDTIDVSRSPGDALAAQRRHAKPTVLAMLNQTHQLAACLEAPDPWRALVDKFPDLGSVRRALGTSPEPLIALLRRYAEEWRALPYPLVQEFVGRGSLAAPTR